MNTVTIRKTRKKTADKDDSSLTKAAKHQAGLAEYRARRALFEANRLEVLAKKIEIQAEAFAYKASVEDDHAKTYEQKSKTVSEAQERYDAAFSEVEKRDRRSPTIRWASQRKTKAKTIPVESTELKDNTNKKITDVRPVYTKEELEANEAYRQKYKEELAKAEIELKKASLELKAAREAMRFYHKHAKARDVAKAQSEAKKVEASARREEAKAKKDEAFARRSEEKAIRSGRTNEAEGFKRNAQNHRARAIELESENREKYNQKRRKPEDIPHKKALQNSTIHSYSNGRKTQLRKRNTYQQKGYLKAYKQFFRTFPILLYPKEHQRIQFHYAIV